MPQVYTVPEQYAGKTLSNLVYGGGGVQQGSGGNAGALAGFLGIGENTPLTAGQAIYGRDIPSNYRGSSEEQALNKLFGAGVGESQYAQDQATTARNKAIAPAVASYQSRLPQIGEQFQQERQQIQGEVEPLKARYNALLEEIKGKEQRQVSAAQTSASQEFGKRGIPTSSTAYNDYLGQTINPIQDQYTNLYKQTGLEQESGLRNLQNMLAGLLPQQQTAEFNITNALAQLQASGGNAGIEDAFRNLQLQAQERQTNTQNELAKQAQQLAQSRFDFEKTQTTTPNIKDNFLSLGEGSTLYNLLTGQPLYTAPKAYKPSSQFGSNLPDLSSIFD